MAPFQAAQAWQRFWLPRLEQVQCARRLEEHAHFLSPSTGSNTTRAPASVLRRGARSRQSSKDSAPTAPTHASLKVLVALQSPTFVLRCVSTCSARRRAGFMSSGPATAALSYALLIACASMPLLLPVSYVAVKLCERRRFVLENKKKRHQSGIEMEVRDAWKIDAIPRQLHASQVEANLSKARIVPVVAYFCRASGMGRARYYFVHVCACACRGVSAARAYGGQERRARAIRDCITQPSACFHRRLPPARAATTRACRSPNGTTGGTFACCWVTAMYQHDAVCCWPATKWISRRSSAVSSRKRSGRRRTVCMVKVST